MFIPIITVFTDVVRLMTFQPPAAKNDPFRRPCAEADLAPAERPCGAPAVRQPVPLAASTTERRADPQDRPCSRPGPQPSFEKLLASG